MKLYYICNQCSKDSKKCIINLGKSKRVKELDYMEKINGITYNKLNKMRKNCMKIVDGNGTSRVIQNILSI